jgi:hypothetical protein
MARKVRPVHCWGIVKRDYINIKGLGDCRVLSDPRYSCESLDIIQFWIMTPAYKPFIIAMSEDSYLNVVEFIDDDDEEFTEEIERVMMCELRRGDKFYFGQRKHTFFHLNLDQTAAIKTADGRSMDLRVSPFKVVRRARKARVIKTKPLSFTEFALSSYEKALSRLAEAVSRYQMDPARVEVQKPAKKAENATPVITSKDVPSPAPVVPETKPGACKCDEDCDRSYCLDSLESKAEPDRVLTCSDVITELEEVRLHEGDLPVSIVSPEDGFRRVNVSGSMLEDLYECGETYWGSRTWDTRPRPGSPDNVESDLVVSLW